MTSSAAGLHIVKELRRALGRLRHGWRTLTSRDLAEVTFGQSPHGTLLVDARTLRILTANEVLLAALGLREQELASLTLPQLFPAESGEDLVGRMSKAGPKTMLRATHKTKDGRQIELEISGYRVNLDGRPVLAFTTHEVTLRSRFEAQLLEKQQHLDHLAHHDPLTGLPNRLFLTSHLPTAIEHARRNDQVMAILFLDLDRFKHINDSRGHETGDQLLKAVAQRIRATARRQDVVVRMGGDEFVVLLRNVVDAGQINFTATRILEALSSPVVIDGRPLVTTVSIGVSLYPRDGTDMVELLRHSDTAMYHAKDRGRNNCQVFSPMMDRRLKLRIAIETQLREALQNKRLEVFYQPIVDMESHRVVALEALLRWRRPGHGFISPERFIGIAEETGLIVPIGEFVLERVLDNASEWRANGLAEVPIAVNVSALQLQRSNLADLIVKLTRARQLDPGVLQIELTESAIFERREGRDGEVNHDAVSHLRDLGLHIAIDDFGTGYSSLSYLKRWRVDSLKIDRSFIRDLGTDLSDLAIVGAIIAMARHLNIQVVAEGVEGWQQLEKLRDLGCRFGQGHLFARPTAADQCRRFLTGLPLDLRRRDVRSGPLDATINSQGLIFDVLRAGEAVGR